MPSLTRHLRAAVGGATQESKQIACRASKAAEVAHRAPRVRSQQPQSSRCPCRKTPTTARERKRLATSAGGSFWAITGGWEGVARTLSANWQLVESTACRGACRCRNLRARVTGCRAWTRMRCCDATAKRQLLARSRSRTTRRSAGDETNSPHTRAWASQRLWKYREATDTTRRRRRAAAKGSGTSHTSS
eukprot:28701_6